MIHHLAPNGKIGLVLANGALSTQSSGEGEIRKRIIEDDLVEGIVAMPTQLFYSVTIPVTLWFITKGKKQKGKTLFIDARNYYTVVDRTLNEWTEWQLRNLQAIVHLYRGEKEKYQSLIRDYIEILDNVSAPLTQERLEEVIKNGEKEYSTRFAACLEYEKKQAKDAIAAATRKEKKQVEAEWKETIEYWEDLLETARQFEWLTEKFGDGEYKDVLGLCKIASIQEIEEKNYSLTPGAYVGVAEQEDDGVDFHERMNEIHAELAQLNQEASVLMDEIQKAWEELR